VESGILDRAHALIEDFVRLWNAEPNPAKRRKLRAAIFRGGLAGGQYDRPVTAHGDPSEGALRARSAAHLPAVQGRS